MCVMVLSPTVLPIGRIDVSASEYDIVVERTIDVNSYVTSSLYADGGIVFGGLQLTNEMNEGKRIEHRKYKQYSQ
jgi:hypothetical protein